MTICWWSTPNICSFHVPSLFQSWSRIFVLKFPFTADKCQFFLLVTSYTSVRFMFSRCLHQHFSNEPLDFGSNMIWLVVWTPLKNISQLGWSFPIYGKIKHVPNHQPVIQWHLASYHVSWPNTRFCWRNHHSNFANIHWKPWWIWAPHASRIFPKNKSSRRRGKQRWEWENQLG